MKMICEFWALKVRWHPILLPFSLVVFFPLTGIISFIGYSRRNGGRRRWGGDDDYLQWGGEWGRGSRATHFLGEQPCAIFPNRANRTIPAIRDSTDQVIADLLIEAKLTGHSCHNPNTPAGFTLRSGLPVCTYCTPSDIRSVREVFPRQTWQFLTWWRTRLQAMELSNHMLAPSGNTFVGRWP